MLAMNFERCSWDRSRPSWLSRGPIPGSTMSLGPFAWSSSRRTCRAPKPRTTGFTNDSCAPPLTTCWMALTTFWIAQSLYRTPFSSSPTTWSGSPGNHASSKLNSSRAIFMRCASLGPGEFVIMAFANSSSFFCCSSACALPSSEMISSSLALLSALPACKAAEPSLSPPGCSPPGCSAAGPGAAPRHELAVFARANCASNRAFRKPARNGLPARAEMCFGGRPYFSSSLSEPENCPRRSTSPMLQIACAIFGTRAGCSSLASRKSGAKWPITSCVFPFKIQSARY
mmetsp:Transcript_69870/g.188846  ORF Transcript_69870/g.188846 Transcript_69870/m.188846 type:complete len:286 (+) Transcript_69870:666-1523(+)